MTENVVFHPLSEERGNSVSTSAGNENALSVFLRKMLRCIRIAKCEQ
jgi:hypothetical protein